MVAFYVAAIPIYGDINGYQLYNKPELFPHPNDVPV